MPAVPHRRCSYAALRLPGVLRPRLRFPLPSAYLGVGVFSYPLSSLHPPTLGRPRFASCWLPWAVLSEEYVGASQVTGSSSSGVPNSNTPSRPVATHPPCVASAPPSAEQMAWAPGNDNFGAECFGPHARLPTHRLCCYCHWRKAGYRPAGLRFGRVGFAPTGRRSGFQGLIVFPLPTRPALPGRTCSLFFVLFPVPCSPASPIPTF